MQPEAEDDSLRKAFAAKLASGEEFFDVAKALHSPYKLHDETLREFMSRVSGLMKRHKARTKAVPNDEPVVQEEAVVEVSTPEETSSRSAELSLDLGVEPLPKNPRRRKPVDRYENAYSGIDRFLERQRRKK